MTSRSLAEKWGLSPVLPGLAVAAVVGIAATFLSVHYRASAMLFALLLGMALNFLAEEGKCRAGIHFASGIVLRTGVALLGLRITFAQVSALGWGTVALVVAAVALTILAGIAVARAMQLGSAFGTLTGGAVAICGASAALAIASILPQHKHAERDASFTVIGVTALSTTAMILYPIVVGALGLDHRAAGIFLGATIHDVAQVVGAGYSLSNETGDAATLVKLLRVAMLLPVIVLAAAITRARLKAAGGTAGGKRPPLLPGFAVGFAVLVAINSTGWVPAPIRGFGNEASRWCLVAAIAGIGMKTQLKDLATVGFKPVALMIGETVFLAGLALSLMRWLT